MSSYLTPRLLGHERITVHTRSSLLSADGGGHLRAVTWRDENTQSDQRLETAGLFVMIGAVPQTGWLSDAGVDVDERGFIVTGDAFATSMSGVFAVGDVRAGSVKRVGEGSVVVAAVHSYLAGGV
jgi:thioredoxin reductase (NADPH)